MKKIYSLLFILFTLQASAVNPVPNPSFENWTSGAPDGWFTSNLPGYTPITQTTTAHSGTYAAHGQAVNGPGGVLPPLLYANGSGMGFPVTQKNKYLNFFCQLSLAAGDELIYTVSVTTAYDNSIGVGAGIITSSTSGGWSYITDTINYFVDSAAAYASITFTISNPGGTPSTSSTFIIDDVSMTGIVGVEEIGYAGKVKVFPVPAHDYITVSGLPGNKQTELTIMDVTGRMIQQKELPAASVMETSINLEGYEKGIYFLMLTTDEKTLLRRISIQ